MEKMIKKIAALASAFLITVGGLCSPAFADEVTEAPQTDNQEGVSEDPLDLYANNAVLMDADTGAVLYNKGMNEAGHPASVTKVMTTYLALKYGNLSDKVVMTETGVSLAYSGSSNLYTVVGEEFTLEQLLYGTMLKSANDMATQVGEYIGGGLDSFVSMMNSEAAALGCTNTNFGNACGLPDEGNTTSPYDIAVISRAALKIDKFREIIGTQSYTIPPTNMIADSRSFTTHVALMVDGEYKYDDAIGGKTGYTDGAMNCLVAYAQRDGRTLIAVSFHANSAGECCQDCTKMFEYGFNNYTNIDIEDINYPGIKGIATIPVDADTSKLIKSGENRVQMDGEELMDLSFSYEDNTVGHIYMTMDEYNHVDDTMTEESEPSEEEMTGDPYNFGISEGESEPGDSVFPRKGEFSAWIKKGPHIILFVLFVLIIVFIILVIVMKIARLIRRARKRREYDEFFKDF